MQILMLLLAFTTFSHGKRGYVSLPSGHSVYADYDEPENGMPTVVLVNGLVYDMNRWNDLARPLARKGFGVLRFYFRGQSLTLKKELEKGAPSFYRTGLDRKGFAQELSELLDALEIRRATIVGLSYGAGIAAAFGEIYPEKVDKLIFLAPLVVSLDRYDPNGAWVHMNLEALKLFWGPLWGPYVYDFYYNWIFRMYMNQRLVPERIPEEMQGVAADYKESIFHLVRAMRDFDLRSMRFPGLKGRVHMMLASEEDTPALKDQFLAWHRFGAAQGSLLYLHPSWHAIPDAVGAYAGDIIRSIMTNEKGFAGGQTYYTSVESGLGGLEPMTAEDLEQRVFRERD